ncbi:MAG: hypothetical protein HOI45_20155 [Rhodospirillaceae bacterium]|nr:hypothetical protein [Rhodospirillales bacterium]MBT6222036.1 hypothetical protein [Rhodospirillaceae bacterium]
MTKRNAIQTMLPPRQYLSREEAAAWLGVSVDTFMAFHVRYCDFGPRVKRWDVVDIQAYAEQNKCRDSARTPQTQERRGQCDSSSVRAHQTGGSHGTTRTESAIAEVLELPIEG